VVHASQPVIESDREVTEDSGDADDRQVGEPERVGAEQVAQGWQIQPGDLQREGDRNRHERVGRSAGTGPDAEGDAQLGDAQGQEHHALHGRPVACAHRPIPRVIVAMTTPMRTMRCHRPAPSTLSAGGQGGWRMTSGSADSAPRATPAHHQQRRPPDTGPAQVTAFTDPGYAKITSASASSPMGRDERW